MCYLDTKNTEYHTRKILLLLLFYVLFFGVEVNVQNMT